MSEAELHQIRARLTGGMLSKARRGELRFRLPVGFVYDAKGNVVLDPDREVRESVGLLFAEFRRTGSAHGAARAFREKGLVFPTRLHGGPGKGELVWRPLTAGRVFGVLANPRYAGAYAYGRRQGRRTPSGAVVMRPASREEWTVLIPDAHEGYISFADVRGEPEARPRQRPRREEVPAAGGAGAAAGPGGLRPLRGEDDGPISHLPRGDAAGLRLSGPGGRPGASELPEPDRHRGRRGDRGPPDGGGHPFGAHGDAGGGGGAFGEDRGGGRAPVEARGASGVRGGPRPAALCAGRSRPPARGGHARGGVEPEAPRAPGVPRGVRAAPREGP